MRFFKKSAAGSDTQSTADCGGVEFIEGANTTVTVGETASGRAQVTIDLDSTLGIELSNDDDYASASSYQTVAADLNVDAAAGRNVADGTSFLAGVMGNILGAAQTKTGNYIAGLIGHFNVTGTNATTYPSGAVLGGIGDGVTDCDGAFVAYIDGDSAQTNAGAAFKVRSNNSTAASGFAFGVDLQDAAHDGYAAVDKDFYTSAPMRIVEDVCVLVNSGAPSDGVSGTGAGVAGPGSLYVDIANGKWYTNTNTKGSPTWTVVGSQS